MSRKSERGSKMFQTLAYELSVLYKDFYAYASARLHPFGLHNGWIFFMLYVGKHPDCAPAELTKALRVDWGYSQRCITKLVSEGFMTKEKAGRSYRLNLTEKGRQVYQESHQLFFDWDRQRLEALSETERDTLKGLLRKISQQKGDAGYV